MRDGAVSKTVAAESLRRRILEYIAQHGGELRSESGQGLRRQISDALAERPTPVGQALIALEKAGWLEREMDLDRHRCQVIRLVSRPPIRRPRPEKPRECAQARAASADRPMVVPARQRAELELAERELNDLIRRAAAVSRRVGELRRALLQADASHVPSR